VSQFWCSTCHQFFVEAGFCPYDGTQLAQPPTQLTGPQSSQPETLRASSAAEGSHEAALAALGPPRNDYDRLIGTTLDGRYHIERKIGEGGMGVVFAARHAVIEKPLAIKVLKREVARDTATIKRFVQEAKAATRIGHPSIVDVTDFGTTAEGMTYSVMEYVDGATLSSVIKKHAPLSLGRAVPIIAQIARALGAAHAKGIVHRDLKPENVFLVNRDGRRDFVKIVDFGIAKVTPVDGTPGDGPRLTRAGAVFGTPEYMAPEQAAGRADTDQRVDVYALATILYEMLVGKVPHKSESMVRTLAMQMLDPIVPPSKARPDVPITAELEAVVMKGLAKKRDERYPDMADFVTDLERACPGVPTGVPPPEQSGPLQLVPAPPGADPRAMSGLPTLHDEPSARVAAPPDAPTQKREPRSKPPTGSNAPTQRDEGPRATSKRVANEPRFVTSERPMTFDHVFDDDGRATELHERPRSKVPLILLLVVLAAGAGIAAALVLRTSSSDERASVPADGAVARVIVDAGVASVDAVVVAEVPPDAAIIDAGTRVVRTGNGKKKVDGGVPRDRLTARGTVAVQIFSKPDGATIYAGDSYRGVSGVTLEETPGTRVKIKCTLPGYEPGFADVVFDGDAEVVMCRPVRPKRCIDNIKNPFDDCPAE
jgi:serine/threonine protein kinase